MSAATQVTGPAVVPDAPTEKKSKEKLKPKETQRDLRPTKTLPTERINFDKQLNLLRAYAAASTNGTKSVSLEEVSDVFGMTAGTVSMANPFFASIGLISKTESGYMPAAEVVSFLRAFEWTPDSASTKLAPIIEQSWFYSALRPRLAFGPMEEEAAITQLGEAASAGPDYKRNLQMLVDYTVAAGLAIREGSQLKLAKPAVAVPENQTTRPTDAPKAIEPDATPKARITSAFAKTTEGAVNFHVSVRVDMDEFAGWQPDRIAAFFAGIAKVLAAKANVELEAGS